MNSYELSRKWFDWCFDNPDIITPNHTALYFFAMDHCNRMGWKPKFGFPMEMAKDAIGIKNYRTYAKTFSDLVEWGFIVVYQKSKNQYSANVIGLVKNTKATSKALTNAIQKHGTKQVHDIVGVDKPITIEPITLNSERAITLTDFKITNLIIENALGWNGLLGTWSKIAKLTPDQTREKLTEFLNKQKYIGKEYKDLVDLKGHIYSWFEKTNFKTPAGNIDTKKVIDNITYDARPGEKIH